ncbi:Ig-like domain-containing protein [Candidatus Parcubacteria bacterium]|nr:Ig-like domain-containing protein [Candidatus Parcubacteria bacterium]
MFPENNLFAQSLDTGLDYAENFELGNSDPRDTLVNVIAVLFTFLGIIVTLIIMYGGWLWMTSNGDAAQVDKAKSTLKNAVIGLIIILAAYGIALFIINMMNNNDNPTSPNYPAHGTGFAALGSCSVISVYPEPGQKEVPRNTSLMVTFREAVSLDSICGAVGSVSGCVASTSVIRLFHSNQIDDGCYDFGAPGAGCSSLVNNISVYTSDNKTFVFIPQDYIGSPSEYIDYTSYFTNDILRAHDGTGIFSDCQDHFLNWSFEVSNVIDLTPPQVESVIPEPDNHADDVTHSGAISSKWTIDVGGAPEVYSPASFTFPVVSVGPSPGASLTMNSSCSDSGNFTAVVANGNVTVQLQKGGTLIMAVDSVNGSVTFPGYFTLTLNNTAPGFQAPNSWNINGVTAEVMSDNLIVGSTIYNFVPIGSIAINTIPVNAVFAVTANNICNVINGFGSSPVHDGVSCTSVVGTVVSLEAKVIGTFGGNVPVQSSAPNTTINIIKTDVGVDSVKTVIALGGMRDKARNIVIQINFNEAINAMHISGEASDVQAYIRVVNATSSPIATGFACSMDADCVSFHCSSSTNVCIGANDYLEGKFEVSNQYRTTEFVSNNKCGVNACGEDIYCLPENAHIAVELVAADLFPCALPADCASKAPYTTCNANNHCEDSGGVLLPTSDIFLLNGIMDAALNSLDGDRSGDSIGPTAGNYYNDNSNLASPIVPPVGVGDNYKWLFFVNDEIDLSPPSINNINPNLAATSVNRENNIEITFNEIMMSSTLQSGSRIITNDLGSIEHQLININETSGIAVGYWLVKENLDLPPQDNFADVTKAMIRHGRFGNASTYITQVGSGVKDIYQNCYKPSEGPSLGVPPCTSASNPSCCYGVGHAGETCP